MRHTVLTAACLTVFFLQPQETAAQYHRFNSDQPSVEINLDVLDDVDARKDRAPTDFRTYNTAPVAPPVISAPLSLPPQEFPAPVTIAPPSPAPAYSYTPPPARKRLLKPVLTAPAAPPAQPILTAPAPSSKPVVPEHFSRPAIIDTPYVPARKPEYMARPAPKTEYIARPAPKPEPVYAPPAPPPVEEQVAIEPEPLPLDDDVVAPENTLTQEEGEELPAVDVTAEIERAGMEATQPLVPALQKDAETSAPAVPLITDLSLAFNGNSSELTPESQQKLDNLATELSSVIDRRLQVRAYAAGEDGSKSSARRIALSRALMVRSYLMDKGIKPNRVDVRAMGSETERSPLDRVDLVFAR